MNLVLVLFINRYGLNYIDLYFKSLFIDIRGGLFIDNISRFNYGFY